MNTRFPFAKMSGSGNDFVVIDNREALLAGNEIGPFTRAACRRGVGLGAVAAGLVEQPVSVVVSSGQALGVTFTRTDAGYTEIRLTGEARFVATGMLDPEGLR